ncbi:MAG: TetR/AcrR family transcriptional regulator [Myxococcota bacterium]
MKPAMTGGVSGAGAPDTEASTRKRVLEAALTLFSERGLQAPSLREVARTAGVSLGALQHYFPTREDLHQAVMAHAVSTFPGIELLRQLGEVEMEALLRAGLHTNVSWARAHPRVRKLGTHLALEQPEHEWPGEAETNAELVRRIRRAQENGELRAFDPACLLVLVEILMNGWSSFQPHYARHLSHVEAEKVDAVFLDFVVDVVMHGLKRR